MHANKPSPTNAKKEVPSVKVSRRPSAKPKESAWQETKKEELKVEPVKKIDQENKNDKHNLSYYIESWSKKLKPEVQHHQSIVSRELFARFDHLLLHG